MSRTNPDTHSWIDGYNVQKEAVAEHYGPKPAAAPPAEERDSLNRLQIMLIWFASVLIAVTLYSQISNAF